MLRKGDDTTTRTGNETAGSGKDLGFWLWPRGAGRCKQHLTLAIGPHPSPAASPATVEEPRARTESRCAPFYEERGIVERSRVQMWYSLSVMIGDGKGSFWCGTEGKYMSSEPTSRARAGPGEEEEEEEKSSATRFELGGPKGALRFDETTPSPGGSATAAAQGTAAGGSALAPGSTLGGSDGNDGASAAVAWQAVTAARLALRRWREGPGWCCSGGL